MAAIQALGVFAVAALIALGIGSSGVAREWLGTWLALVDQTFEATGLNAFLEFFVAHVPDVLRNSVLIVAIVVIGAGVELLRRRRRDLFERSIGRSGEIIGHVRGLAGTFAAFLSSFTISFARFVVAPALTSAVTVSLTWNIHMWMNEAYGPNYALASVSSVVAATCLLLALGLQRLIPA